KLSAVVGSFVGHFQIPNRPGVSPRFTVSSVSEFDSTRVDETQREQSHFAVLSYLRASEGRSLQAAAFVRYSAMSFHPDRLADLLFNGIAQRVDRSSVATGVQIDSAITLDPAHTLRAGAYVAVERTSVQSSSDVLPADDGVPTSDQPFRIFESRGTTGYT